MDAAQKREIAQALHDSIIAYWHDVDFNWGRNAGAHYTEDGVFEGDGADPYVGRREIEEFYGYRLARGPRVAIHAVVNFTCDVLSAAHAEAAWICMIHAHDGEPPQASAPPINVSLVRDCFVRDAGGAWLCQRRSWRTLFTGGVPATRLSREERDARRASDESS